MTLGQLGHALAKTGAQRVWFAIYKGVHKCAALSWFGALQVQFHAAVLALELLYHRLQQMAAGPITPSQRHLAGPVGADDQHRVMLDPAPQVKEQVDGGAVGPLHIVQHQYQRPVAGQDVDHLGELLENLVGI